jgi:septal ring-binding cell division protein DamX
MHFRTFVIHLLLSITLLSFSACQSSRQFPLERQVQQNENLCEKYSFLRAYHCSFDQVQLAARKGDTRAQYTLGYLYYYGIGVLPNEARAYQWIRLAASQNNSSAVNALALLSNKNTSAAAVQKQPRKTVVHNMKHQAKGFTCASDRKGYTIQVVASGNLTRLNQFVQRNRSHFKTEPFVYRQVRNSAPWYVLTYGYYATRNEASIQLNHLSPEVSQYQPWIRPCTSLIVSP